MKIAVVLGTRPEIIKLSTLLRYLDKSEIETCIIHSGQHSDYGMSEIFFKELEVPHPKHFLGIPSHATFSEQIAAMIPKLEKVLRKEEIDHIVVLGDTNTTLAGALSAKNLKIAISHVEAGCRCYCETMQEEINRKIVDHIATYLFAPSKNCIKNLEKEGITKNVHYSGNTLVDILTEKINVKTGITRKLGVKSKRYAVITVHRAENIDHKKKLEDIISILKDFPIDLVFPIHPRTQWNINQFRMKIPRNVIKSKPLGYFDFIGLLKNSTLALTDSGGVVEEAAIMNVPCITLRDSTEWMETIDAGKNFLTGASPKATLSLTNRILNDKEFHTHIINAPNPFPMMNASERIFSFMKTLLR